ncbi:MAG: zinc-binding alcohol dehydrogenase family protein [Sphaerochaetaceae bacterium]|nr:zinc-binding alcohol dehydrogenase family protein [Sphaerochaetaceae bacterium]
MKGFQITEIGKSRMTDTLVKPVPSGGEVLVHIKRVGFCGSDLNTYRGRNPLVRFPLIPGHEIAGVIEETGSDVPDSFTVGDKVSVLPYTTCGVCASCLSGRVNACKNNQTLGVQRDGAMAEYITVPFEKLITGVNELSFEAIALVEPLAVGFHAARRIYPAQGDHILVFGCGLVGLGAITNLAILGARVIAVDIDDEKLRTARDCGAQYTINSVTGDLAGEVAVITGGHGPTGVIEAIGLPQTYTAAVDLVSYAGRVVYVGYASQAVEFVTKQFVLKEIEIRGSRNALKEDFSDVLAAMKQDRVPVETLVSKVVPLEEASSALHSWSEDPKAITKILVSFP